MDTGCSGARICGGEHAKRAKDDAKAAEQDFLLTKSPQELHIALWHA